MPASSAARPLTRLQRVSWVLVSLLFGLLSVFSAIAVRVDPAAGFRGVEMQATDAEPHYAARVEEIRDGFLHASNVFYAGDKNQPYLQPPLPEWIVSGLGTIAGLNAAWSVILSQVVFGTIVCAVMIGCFYAITRRFWWALFGVASYVFAGFMYSGPWMIWRILTNTQGTLEFLTFARPINPQWSATLFFGACWGIAVWYRTRSRKALAVAGVMTILSFYSYVYSWTLLAAIYVVMGCRELVKRNFERVKDLLILGGALLVGFMPYLWNVWRASQHPFYTETSIRLGLVQSHQPIFGAAIATLIAIVIVFQKRLGDAVWFVTAFAIASCIVLNQQVITGHAIVLSHYHWYFIKPFTMILGTILVGSCVYDRWGRRFLARIPAALLVSMTMLVLFAHGFLYQWRSYQAALPFWRTQQSAAGTLSYLHDHTKPGDVTYASGFIHDLIPVYTSGDVYWATNAYGYLSSDERARDAYFFDLWLKGVSADEADHSFPTDRREELSSRIHAIYYREANASFGAIPDEEVNADAAAYRTFLAEPFEAKLGKYPLDYVVVSQDDPHTPGWQELIDHSTEIYTDHAFQIRKVQGG